MKKPSSDVRAISSSFQADFTPTRHNRGMCVLRISHVCLSVRDQHSSSRFYRELFGMEVGPVDPPSETARRCILRDERGGEFGIVLRQGHPSSVEPGGVDHFCLEVPGTGDVNRFYDRARELGAQATGPRMYEGYWQTFIFDPDGYKIEVLTREAPVGTPGLDPSASEHDGRGRSVSMLAAAGRIPVGHAE
jgi:catechol 2,3-dioxygenase-like lactoylglutathione lyase family enzyme